MSPTPNIVLLAESAAATIQEAATGAHPSEIGGVLVGVWNQHRPWITHALVVPAGTPNPLHYTLQAGITHQLIHCARRYDHRLGYLGEWHVHPADTGPSQKDGRTMTGLTRKDENAPILVLARRTGDSYTLDAYTWPRLRRRQLRIIHTGDLSQEETGSSPPGPTPSTRPPPRQPTPTRRPQQEQTAAGDQP